MFMNSKHFGLQHLGFPEIFGGPRAVRKVREGVRICFRQSSSKRSTGHRKSNKGVVEQKNEYVVFAMFWPLAARFVDF